MGLAHCGIKVGHGNRVLGGCLAEDMSVALPIGPAVGLAPDVDATGLTVGYVVGLV